MNKFTKQCVAAVASLAMAGTLCVAGAVVAGSSAWAAQTAAEKAPWDTTLETNKKGSITIHKKDRVDSQSAQGLNGAEFTVKKVSKFGTESVNLKDQDNWVKLAAKVKDLNEWVAAHGNNSAAGVSATGAFKVEFDKSFGTNGESKKNTAEVSGEKGVAKFDSLEIGLYYVYESKVPDGYSAEFVPFFVTVPQITRESNNVNNTYTYDVNVSPKNRNAKEDIIKDALTSKIVGAGDTLPYVITTKVTLPSDASKDSSGEFETKNLTNFQIYDDALISAYDDLDISKISAVVKVGEWDSTANDSKGGLKTGSSEITKTTEYSLSVSDSEVDNNSGATRKRILFKFDKDAGLKKIIGKFNKDSSKDVRVQITLNLKLKKDLKTVGSKNKLANKYGFIPGHKPGGPDTHITGKTTETEFRKFHILKYDGTTGQKQGDAKKGLPKAEFKAFTNKGDADKCAKDPNGNDNCKNAMPGFNDVAQTNTEATITTTDTDGKTKDYVAKVTDVNSKIYVVEIKAPEGFARSEKSYEVNLTSAENEQAQEIEIPNVPDNKGNNWFTLPKTGAAGVIIFALVGLGLVGSGMFVFLKNRKKEEEQQAA
ncbi:SpaH/EbpB family LPXTG-anchored major pilin [Gardnerella vaginalis]|uniref:SpaH/EbpB family LPXTG-anchored major pilin n=1 Tax=Gardnerella vaginalis TaxID=2702 RepID=UPI0039EEF090